MKMLDVVNFPCAPLSLIARSVDISAVKLSNLILGGQLPIGSGHLDPVRPGGARFYTGTQAVNIALVCEVSKLGYKHRTAAILVDWYRSIIPVGSGLGVMGIAFETGSYKVFSAKNAYDLGGFLQAFLIDASSIETQIFSVIRHYIKKQPSP